MKLTFTFIAHLGRHKPKVIIEVICKKYPVILFFGSSCSIAEINSYRIIKKLSSRVHEKLFNIECYAGGVHISGKDYTLLNLQLPIITENE